MLNILPKQKLFSEHLLQKKISTQTKKFYIILDGRDNTESRSKVTYFLQLWNHLASILFRPSIRENFHQNSPILVSNLYVEKPEAKCEAFETKLGLRLKFHRNLSLVKSLMAEQEASTK